MLAVGCDRAVTQPRRQAFARGTSRPRRFFFARTAQHVRSSGVLREVARAAAALGGLAAWTSVLLLLSV